MSRHVRHTLLALGAGTVTQRMLVLLLNVWLMRHLGIAGFGEFAFGTQMAALAALLADSGVRLLTAREIAADRQHGVACLRASLAIRLRRALLVTAAFAGGVGLCSTSPTFLLVCAALIPLSTFDMKQLADALGRAGVEVRFETTATCAYVALTALVLACDGGLAALAAALLASRGLYAILAWRWLTGLTGVAAAPAAWNLRHAGALGAAQLGFELVFSSQVVVLRALLGADAAGSMAAAQRIVLAVETPVRLLARLLLPHLMHASRHGDAGATLERAVRASAHMVLPLAAGGFVVAEPLLALLSGPTYVAAAWALRWQLVASVVVGTMSHYGQALVAHGRVRPYLTAVAVGIALDVGLTLATVWSFGATGAAFAAAVALATAAFICLAALRRAVPLSALRPWRLPALHALLVAAAAGGAASGGVTVQLGAGALAFALGLFWLELRGRTRQVGAGLQRSSGFMREGTATSAPSEPATHEFAEVNR